MNLVEAGTISGKQAKEVFAEMFANGKTATEIVKEKRTRIERPGAIEALCDQAIAGNPSGGRLQGGTRRAKFSQGQVMKLSKGNSESNLVANLQRKLR